MALSGPVSKEVWKSNWEGQLGSSEEDVGASQARPKAATPGEDRHSGAEGTGLLPPESVQVVDGDEQISQQESRRTFFILGGLGGLLAGLIWWWNPADWHMPVCTFYRLTGWYCPGCGGLRAAHALLHGRLAEAWAYNPLLVLLTPWLGYGVVRWGLSAFWPKRRWPGPWLYSPWVLMLVAVLATVFGILRNLPWEPFCDWAPGP